MVAVSLPREATQAQVLPQWLPIQSSDNASSPELLPRLLAVAGLAEYNTTSPGHPCSRVVNRSAQPGQEDQLGLVVAVLVGVTPRALCLLVALVVWLVVRAGRRGWYAVESGSAGYRGGIILGSGMRVPNPRSLAPLARPGSVVLPKHRCGHFRPHHRLERRVRGSGSLFRTNFIRQPGVSDKQHFLLTDCISRVRSDSDQQGPYGVGTPIQAVR